MIPVKVGDEIWEGLLQNAGYELERAKVAADRARRLVVEAKEHYEKQQRYLEKCVNDFCQQERFLEALKTGAIGR